jgi:rhamnosyltransferase
MNNSKVTAVVVSFNDADAVIRCVKALRHQVHSIIVVDNGSENNHQLKLKNLNLINTVTIYQCSENLGIGAAINLATKSLDNSKVDWVLTMDQDSIAAPDMVECLLSASTEFTNAIFTPFITDIGHKNTGNKPIEVNYAITSGNLVPLSIMRGVNGLNSELFIDGVDFDFSLRLRENGYIIIRVPLAKMRHRLGMDTTNNILKSFYTNHAPLRRYYMSRNLIINFRRHVYHFPFFLFRILFVAILSFVSTLLFGPQRLESIVMIIRGIFDGLRNKTGKIIN